MPSERDSWCRSSTTLAVPTRLPLKWEAQAVQHFWQHVHLFCIRSTNVGIQIQIQRATQRLSWLLAGLGPEGSVGSWRARQGTVPPGLPRHVGHKGALASLGHHHEMQGTGSHVLQWRGGPSGTAEHPGLLKATDEGPASDPVPSSLRGQHVRRPGYPSSHPNPSTLIPCSELMLKCCGLLESAPP